MKPSLFSLFACLLITACLIGGMTACQEDSSDSSRHKKDDPDTDGDGTETDLPAVKTSCEGVTCSLFGYCYLDVLQQARCECHPGYVEVLGPDCQPQSSDGDQETSIPDGDEDTTVPDGDQDDDQDTSIPDGDQDGDSCVPDCAGKACGTDGCGGSCGQCQAGDCQNGQCVGTEGQPPRVLSFDTNVTQITEGQSVIFTVVVTDPDGIDDLIGGSLKDAVNGQTYGAFSTSASEGAYSLTVSWNDIHLIRAINFLAPITRTFNAVFYDQSGNTASDSKGITLACGSDGACDGACTDLDSPNDCGGCDITCRYDQVCSSRNCRCPSGEAECSGLCRDTSDDDNHCGQCGHACQNGMHCESSTCQCADGSTNLSSDPDNCGVCENACPDATGGQAVCESSQCGDPCEGVGTNCAGTCEDLASDVYDCGECDRSCWDEMDSYLPAPDTFDNSGYTFFSEDCHEGNCIFKVSRNWPPNQASNSWSCDQICDSWGLSCAPPRPIDSCYVYYHSQSIPVDGTGIGCLLTGDFSTIENVEATILTSCSTAYHNSHMSHVCYCIEDRPLPPITITGAGDYSFDIPENKAVTLTFRPTQNYSLNLYTSNGSGGCPGDTILRLSDSQSGEIAYDDDGGYDTCSNLTASVEAYMDYTVVVEGYGGVSVSGVVLTVDLTPNR